MRQADVIVRAGRVVDLELGSTSAQTPTCVAVVGEHVVDVGGAEVMEAWCGPRTRLHDFPGAAVLPGLVDAHAHPVWGSLSRGVGVAMTDASDLDAVRARLARAVTQLADGRWITGYDLDVNVFPDEPQGRIFEAWFPGVPISLMTRDAHSLVVSPAVVAAVGLTGTETFADASSVVADNQGPTGWLLELQAMDLVLDAYPAVAPADEARHLASGLELLASGGLTGLHALDFHEPSERLFRRLEEDGDLPLRIRASPLVPADSPPEVWAEIAARQGLHGRRWCVDGVKFMLDGTADNGTAWFEHPDSRGQNAASLWRDTGAYREAVRFFARHGIPTTTHAVGDRAVRFALDVFAEVGRVERAPHRIEHIESIPDDLLDRFAETGTVAGLQPTHGTRLTSPDQTDNWSVRLGSERVSHGWRVRDLLDHGAVVALGSDWPIGVGDPRVALADAQLRRPVDEPGRAGLEPSQAIDAVEAYRAMTLAPAVAAGVSGHQGRVAPGHLADLTVLADDPTRLSAEEQAVNPVLATYVGGQQVRLSGHDQIQEAP